jgi:hypothetical protein
VWSQLETRISLGASKDDLGTLYMFNLRKTACLLLVICSYGNVWAQPRYTACLSTPDGTTICPKPDSECRLNRYGDAFCSTPGGGIESDRYGELLCGPGYCVKDRRGDVFCSTAPRGGAALDRYGDAICAEGCILAKVDACVVLKQVK